MIKKTQSNSGFTFIEIIVAVTMLSIIILTLYSLLDVGFSFWSFIDNSRWSYSDIQLVVNKMEKDFRSTFFRSTSDRYPFKGNMYQVNFYSRQFESGDLVNTQYEFSAYDQTLFIIRREQKIPLLSQLDRFNFYFLHPEYGYWDNYWDALEIKRVPAMVRMEFTFIGSDTQYQYDFPIYLEQKGISGR